MALPSSGQISLNDINIELGNSSGSQASLRSMSNTAGFSTPDAISDFYGYSAGDDITLSYGSVTIISSGSTSYNARRPVNRSGQTSATTVFVEISLEVLQLSSASITWYFSVNSTSSWSTIASFSSTSSPTTYILPSVTSLSYTDILRIRADTGYAPSGALVNSTCSLSTVSFDAGTGTSTLGTPSNWTVSIAT